MLSCQLGLTFCLLSGCEKQYFKQIALVTHYNNVNRHFRHRTETISQTNLSHLLWENSKIKSSWSLVYKSITLHFKQLLDTRLAWLYSHINNPDGSLLLQQLWKKLLSDTGSLLMCPLRLKSKLRSGISETVMPE